MYLCSRHDSANIAYRNLVGLCHDHGSYARPRDLECWELRPYGFSITDCRQGLYTGVDRRLNYRFLAIETVAYLAGAGGSLTADLLIAANSRMKQFVNEETGTFDGIYGRRLAVGLPEVYDALNEDPDTRQAVASIWAPDTLRWMREHKSKDTPCTLGLQFFTVSDHDGRSQGLDLHVTMRSNDLHWGWPYDVAAFCSLQLAMANCLGLKPNAYHHTCGSLHLYADHQPELQVNPRTLPLTLPEPPLNTDFRRLMSEAGDWLLDLHDSRLTYDQPWQDFVSGLERPDDDRQTQAYWQAWSDLVRFSWKEHQ